MYIHIQSMYIFFKTWIKIFLDMFDMDIWVFLNCLQCFFFFLRQQNIIFHLLCTRWERLALFYQDPSQPDPECCWSLTPAWTLQIKIFWHFQSQECIFDVGMKILTSLCTYHHSNTAELLLQPHWNNWGRKTDLCNDKKKRQNLIYVNCLHLLMCGHRKGSLTMVIQYVSLCGNRDWADWITRLYKKEKKLVVKPKMLPSQV